MIYFLFLSVYFEEKVGTQGTTSTGTVSWIHLCMYDDLPDGKSEEECLQPPNYSSDASESSSQALQPLTKHKKKCSCSRGDRPHSYKAVVLGEFFSKSLSKVSKTSMSKWLGAVKVCNRSELFGSHARCVRLETLRDLHGWDGEVKIVIIQQNVALLHYDVHVETW